MIGPFILTLPWRNVFSIKTCKPSRYLNQCENKQWTMIAECPVNRKKKCIGIIVDKLSQQKRLLDNFRLKSSMAHYRLETFGCVTIVSSSLRRCNCYLVVHEVLWFLSLSRTDSIFYEQFYDVMTLRTIWALLKVLNFLFWFCLFVYFYCWNWVTLFFFFFSFFFFYS